MWDTLIVSPFINAILFIYSLVGNFGIAIILFTILIRLLTHPLMVSQIKSTKIMQDMQKDEKWLKIQEKYKNDKEKLAQEQMAYYKEIGYSPFSSCLPTLIQFPIIIGLYQSIVQSITHTPTELFRLTQHLYAGVFDISKLLPLNAHFLWMDLGKADWVNIGLPFEIPVLAIIVVVTTYIQNRLIQPSSGTNDQAAMMGNMMNIYMPLLMGSMALTLASGLSLYFVVANVIGILQYAALGRVNWRNILPQPKTNKPVVTNKGQKK